MSASYSSQLQLCHAGQFAMQVTLHCFVTVQTEDRLTCNNVRPCESGHFENWNTCLILKSEMVILWKTRVTFFLSWYPMSSVWYPLGATVKKEFKIKKMHLILQSAMTSGEGIYFNNGPSASGHYFGNTPALRHYHTQKGRKGEDLDIDLLLKF